MSILPTFMTETADASAVTNTLPVPREYGVDFSTGKLTGEIVEGIDAVKVWIWNCLKTERYRFPIYSWQYGVEFEQYIGTTLSDEYIQNDCRAEIEDALKVNPYITGISDFTAEMDGTHLNITFTADTTIGSTEVTADV